MEHAEGEVDPMNSNPSIAIPFRTGDLHVIESQVLQLVDSPWCEHNPGQDGVEEEDEGIGNTSGDTIRLKPRTSLAGSIEADIPVAAFPTHATYCGACCCPATACSEAYDLFV